MGKEEKKVTRRDYLKYTGAAIGGLVVGGALGYVLKPAEVIEKTVTAPGVAATTTIEKTVTTIATTPIPTTLTVPTTISLWRQCKGETIRVTMQDHPSTYALLKHLPEFEKLTGIKVIVDVLPWTALHEKNLTDLQSGTGFYDVISHGAKYTMPLYCKNKWIEPLNDYLEDPDLTEYSYDFEDFFEPFRLLMEEPVWGEAGKIYGVPSYGETSLYYYRKDIFDLKGLTEKDIETVEGYESAAAKCNNPPAIYGALMRGSRDHAPPYVIAYFHMYGAEYLDEDWRPAFNSPEGVEALTRYTEPLLKYGPPGIAGFGFPEVVDTFKLGKAANLPMDASVFAVSPFNAPDSPVKGKVGVYLVPKGPRRRAPDLHAMALSINKMSKHKKAAWLFIQWITSKPIERITTLEGTRTDPCRTSTWNDPMVIKFWNDLGLGKFREVVFQSFEIAKYPEPKNPACKSFEPRFPEYLETRAYIGDALGAVLMGTKTPKEALDEAARKIEKILRDAGYYKK